MSNKETTKSQDANVLLESKRLPAMVWLADYQLRWTFNDFVAGATQAAYAIPVSLA